MKDKKVFGRKKEHEAGGSAAVCFMAMLLSVILLIAGSFAGCGLNSSGSGEASGNASGNAAASVLAEAAVSDNISSSVRDDGKEEQETDTSFSLKDIPTYESSPFAEVNENVPYFTEAELSPNSYEQYGALDSLGRCTAATACIGEDIMPTQKRGSIGEVKPTGWRIAKYEGIDGNYLYNRCHLIAYELSGENANERNLITGTRYMNVEGMLPFENKVADYVKSTGNHVLYRVTPIFEGDNLLASGVLMEAESVEDKGKGIEFCVYCYNVQPGITIDYSDGDSSGTPYTGSDQPAADSSAQTSDSSYGESVDAKDDSSSAGEADYVLNSNTMKFHRPDCRSVKQMSEKNTIYFTGTREEVIEKGYEPCRNCNP